MFEYVLGDNSIRSPYAEIHLMTIKVFTTPRRTPHFEIWQLGSPPVYTVSQRCPPPLFLLSNPLFLSQAAAPLPFSYSFSRFLAEHTHGCRLSLGARRKTVHLPYTTPAVFHIIYKLRPARCHPSVPRNNSGSANARACRQIGRNWGRRNLSRSVTTLSDIAARGSDVQMLKRREENMIAR